MQPAGKLMDGVPNHENYMCAASINTSKMIHKNMCIILEWCVWCVWSQSLQTAITILQVLIDFNDKQT